MSIHEKRAKDRCWAEIDLSGLIHNYTIAKAIAGKNVRIAAVLKGNAYGHGAVTVAQTLLQQGVDMLSVACLDEALEIRNSFLHAQQSANFSTPILVMGAISPENIPIAVQENIELTVWTLKQAEVASKAALDCGKTAAIHIKLDTGLHRVGMSPTEDSLKTALKIATLPGVHLMGVFTHLALLDKEHDAKQVADFMWFCNNLEKAGIQVPFKHVCDSIGLVRYPDYQLDMVRVGALLYGVRPSRWEDKTYVLRTPMCVKARIAQIRSLAIGESVGYDDSFIATRESRIATISAGYADGIPRSLSNKGFVGLHKKRAPIIGLICMDQLMVDITDIADANEGDEVVLLGGDEQSAGENAIPIAEYASWTGMNRNEALSNISRRVPRVYKNGKGTICGIVNYQMMR